MRLAKVAVAILSWNGRRHLETCLAALAEQRDPGVAWEVVVYDNGSTDGTVEWLRNTYGSSTRPLVRVIAGPVNLGFCAGNNRLIEALTDADAVALLNNDTRPEPNWLGELVAALGNAADDVAAVSGLIVDWDGHRLDFAEGLMTFDGHAFQRGFRRPLAQVTLPAAGSELLFACGGNMVVRRDSFLAAGGFDESYFAYLEDVDLGWRLWQGGERVLFTPHAVVHHRSSATSDLLGLYNRGFLFERNAYLNVFKNYEAGVFEQMMPLVELVLRARTLAMLVQNNPNAVTLTLDPYAGLIANTAPREAGANAAATAGVATSLPVSAAVPPRDSLLAKWRRYGTLELLERAIAKLRRQRAARRGVQLVAPVGGPDPRYPVIQDERTIAQFRALVYLLRHLDEAAASRQAVQARRRRSDREIFERFALYLVPTYPGDGPLFASPGFAACLPNAVPLQRAELADLMELDSAP